MKWKELYKHVQEKANVPSTQLLLNMKVHWLSMYIMLNCAESSKVHVDLFIYEMRLLERDLMRCAKIDYFRLTSAEWVHVSQFTDLLLVCEWFILSIFAW